MLAVPHAFRSRKGFAAAQHHSQPKATPQRAFDSGVNHHARFQFMANMLCSFA